ncbi:MAG: tetratricopeptide repeat protein [Terriglobales bacterium]
MAFGFGFNKQKVLSTAEKFVQQGKLQNAIAEYEKILKSDAKDLTVANTVGDLYARLGDHAKAVECFKMVGDAYAAQGFTVKGIAMYKKITKLQPSLDGSLKLAELYTQQGLFNDARAQYLQVAEDFMKNSDFDQAVRLFQKVLEMDPENVPMRVRLAETYVRLGKKNDAWQLFSAAAETLRSRGSLAAADDLLQRMLSLDPSNSYALLLRGHAALGNDDPKKAIQFLEKASDLDSHPEGLRDLLKAFLQTGRLAEAAPLADKLLTVHNDAEALFILAEGYAHAGQFHQALDVYGQHADRLLATDSAKLLTSLHTMIGHVRDDAGDLDLLLQILGKAGESTHVGEVTELLAHASVQNGNLERARDLYQVLATMEPQNQIHLQNYQQVVTRIQAASPRQMITAEEGAVLVDELEATAPVIDQSYPDDVAVALRAALTDADLFLSYNLPGKALVPLLGALPQAPRDVRLNQRLATLHTRAQRFTEVAVCCRNLESVYSEFGFPDEALRYGELAARYEERASGAGAAVAPALGSTQPPAAASPLIPPPAPEQTVAAEAIPGPVAPPSPQEFAVESSPPVSADVFSEWDQSVSVESAPEGDQIPAQEPVPVEAESDASNPAIAETVEEARFYLEHYMPEQARAAFAKLQTLTRDARILDPLRAALESAASQPSPEAEPEITQISADEPPEFEIEVAAEPAAVPSAESQTEPPEADTSPAQPEPEPEPVHAESKATKSGDLAALVADLEASLGESFPESHEPLPAWPQTAPSAPSAPLTSAVGEVTVEPQPEPEPAMAHAEAAVPPIKHAMPVVATTSAGAAAAPAPTLSYSPAPVRPLGAGAQAMHPQQGVDLSQMFGELKRELEEEPIAGDADPETHYNLGIAFREMGLLDEAIAELQKVCSAVERGQPFNQLIQTYTWLAQCFLDKGVPEAAVRWFEKALTIPGLEDESRLAIHYDLGSAYEAARDKTAALRHFTMVYGTNIDYRGVAERIQALKS